MLVISLFDNAVYSFIIQIMCKPVDVIMKLITNLGGATVLISICLIILLLIKNKKYGVFVCINLIVITLINLILKNVVQRQRPNVLRLIEESGYSFP